MLLCVASWTGLTELMGETDREARSDVTLYSLLLSQTVSVVSRRPYGSGLHSGMGDTNWMLLFESTFTLLSVSPHKHPQVSVALSIPYMPVTSPMSLLPWGERIISSRKS